MADLRIVDAPEILLQDVEDGLKLPTGGFGNYSITMSTISDWLVRYKDLADKNFVNNSSNGVRQLIEDHLEDLDNPHSVTKDQIGLGNVNNTADLDKPVSSATQDAIISANLVKADKTYVDIELGKKANSQDVTNYLNTKEDKTVVTNLRKLGGVDYWDGGTYPLHGEARLDNGDVVKSTVTNNTNNPNVDMTGWASESEYVVNVADFKFATDIDDTDSFLRASARIRANNGGVLVIPQNNYVVGRQTSPTGYAYVGMDVIGLYGITGAVEIRLENPTITFKDNLYFGAWDRSTTPPTALTTITTDSNYYSSVGSMIYASDIPMLRITGVGTLDGNLDGVQLGGEWGDTGRQCWGNAFKILNVPDLQISTNIKTKNFPLDSIYIGNSNYSSGDNDYGTSKVSGLNCDGNARQGLSLCGGTNYVIDSCSFKNIGRGSFSSLPKSGVDLEAESGDIRNIKFTSCEIVNCAGFGVDDANGNIDEVNFELCKFIGTTTYSVAVKRSTFTRSTFHGMVGITYRLAEDQKPIFNDCTFSNDPIHSPYGTYLVSSLGAGDMQAEFIDCTFILHSGQFIAKPEANDWRFRRCKFIIPATSTATGDANHIVGNFNSAYMTDCEFIDLRTTGVALYINLLPQYRNKNNTISSTRGSKFWWNRGITSIQHTPSVSDTRGHVNLSRAINTGSVNTLADTASICFSTSLPTDTVLSPSNTLRYWGTGSVVYNSAPSNSSWLAAQFITQGYVCTNEWVSGGSVTAAPGNSGYIYTANRVYKIATSGTLGTTAPTHTSGTVANGTATLTYIDVRATYRTFGALGTAVANSTDSTNVAVQLNALLASLRTAGVIQT